MHLTTGSSTGYLVGRLVEVDALVCPGCHEPVHPEPPTSHDRPMGVPDAEFCHRDGSELCGDARGPGEPIETTR
jgi:hypothetical protein